MGAGMDLETGWRYWRYRIMKEMGWTLEEYKRTPAPVIAEIIAFMVTESKLQSDKAEQHGG